MRRSPAVIGAVALIAIAWLASLLVPVQGNGIPASGQDGHAELIEALAREVDVTLLTAAPTLLTSQDAQVLMLFAGSMPNQAEIDAVGDFAERGGTIVLAADGPPLAAWSAGLGVTLHGLPAATSNATCLLGVGQVGARHLEVCFPSPTAFVRVDQAAEVSPLFYPATNVSFDLDQNGRLDPHEQAADRYPLVLQWTLGNGSIIAIADADLWRSSVIRQHPANLELALELVGGRDVVIDVTGASQDGTGWLRSGFLRAAAGGPGLLPLVIGFGAALVAALASAHLAPWRPHRPMLRPDPEVERQARALFDQRSSGSKGDTP